MDHLWSPWRYQYVSHAQPTSGCVFCEKAVEGRDAENLVVFRGRSSYVLLNLYPYTSGHVMVVPYAHIAAIEETPLNTLSEIMALTQRVVRSLQVVYKPRGLNVGMNLGECAGAGIAGHLHLHVVPRWPGDVNFMTAVGETRVIPEDLQTTYEKLSVALREAG
jgi:ATP adenylyltransferase